MALKDWEDVRNFEKESLEAQHLDAAYILQQLMTCKAFLFTAMPTLVSGLTQTLVDKEKVSFTPDSLLCLHSASLQQKED